MTLFLVSHGRTRGNELDPAGFDDVWHLRDRLPQGAAWFCAPDPAAVATCQLLTEGEVGIVGLLRGRAPTETADEHLARVVRGVTGALDSHRGEDVVLVGEAAAWLAVAETLVPTGPDQRRVLGTPGVLAIAEPLTSS